MEELKNVIKLGQNSPDIRGQRLFIYLFILVSCTSSFRCLFYDERLEKRRKKTQKVKISLILKVKVIKFLYLKVRLLSRLLMYLLIIYISYTPLFLCQFHNERKKKNQNISILVF